VFELPSKEEELQRVKNAQAMALWLLAFQGSLCLVSTSHCCSKSMIFKFALATVLIISSLIHADLQKSPSNSASLG
jgi:hypothetical protein